MNDIYENFFNQPVRGEWVRLRTFIYLRWLAVFGQSGALLVGLFYLDLDLRIDLISSLILLSATINVVATILYPESKRLAEKDITLILLYDLLQLAFLLFLTGGLTNPFAVLVLAPVTISATALRLLPTLFLGGVASVTITLLGFFYLPLKTVHKNLITPEILLIGTWLALLITLIFLASYARRVTVEMASMNEALLATQMALEREQKLTALGGVVAAMAHELGSPLSTIKLVSSEILDDKKLNRELRDDIELINSQVETCKDILHDMGRRGKDDKYYNIAPILNLISEATEPHQNRGREILMSAPGWAGDISDDFSRVNQPNIYRRSEIIHGIRNLVQNAVDFSKSAVLIELNWTELVTTVKIIDDGPGFPSDMLGKLGDPFLNKKIDRKSIKGRIPEYEGMGLGLFIAKTLLERTGAVISFSKISKGFELKIAPEKVFYQGAVVEVKWPTELIRVDESESRKALGPNIHN